MDLSFHSMMLINMEQRGDVVGTHDRASLQHHLIRFLLQKNIRHDLLLSEMFTLTLYNQITIGCFLRKRNIVQNL